MPNNISSSKRLRQGVKRNLRNRMKKSEIRTLTKKVIEAVEALLVRKRGMQMQPPLFDPQRNAPCANSALAEGAEAAIPQCFRKLRV